MPYLYGKADEKYVKANNSTKTQKLKPLDSFKFHLSTQLKGNQLIKPYEVSIRLRTSPEKLIDICAAVLDAVPLPYAFYWNIRDVADWIRRLGFPEYKNTFEKNQINGKNLILLDASYLIKMNIKDLNHLKIVTHAIRSLYGFGNSVFNRSISMPDRDLNNLYKIFRTKTGFKYKMIRCSDFSRLHHLIGPRSLYETHWQSLERWLSHTDRFETELIGERIEDKKVMFQSLKEKTIPMGQKRSYRDCSGMPPCTCNWTNEKDLRTLWQLKYLRTRNKIHHKFRTNTECKCFEICKCYESQKGLALLKEYVPHKYGTTYNL